MEEKLEAFELGEAGPVVPQTLLLLQFPPPCGTQFFSLGYLQIICRSSQFLANKIFLSSHLAHSCSWPLSKQDKSLWLWFKNQICIFISLVCLKNLICMQTRFALKIRFAFLSLQFALKIRFVCKHDLPSCVSSDLSVSLSTNFAVLKRSEQDTMMISLFGSGNFFAQTTFNDFPFWLQ